MTKTKSFEAQERVRLKQAAARQDREGLANLAAAAVAAKAAAIFVDLDLAIGWLAQAATLSPAKKEKLATAGRSIRLDLMPKLSEEAAVDLVARVPADVASPSDLARRLVSLGLRSNRKRATANFLEFAGLSDESAVRAVVEPVGGRVTVIASPPTADTPEDTEADEPGSVTASSSAEGTTVAPPVDDVINAEMDPDVPPLDAAAPYVPGGLFISHSLRPSLVGRPFGNTGDQHDPFYDQDGEPRTKTPEAVD